jgi:hypothetical protein
MIPQVSRMRLLSHYVHPSGTVAKNEGERNLHVALLKTGGPERARRELLA